MDTTISVKQIFSFFVYAGGAVCFGWMFIYFLHRITNAIKDYYIAKKFQEGKEYQEAREHSKLMNNKLGGAIDRFIDFSVSCNKYYDAGLESLRASIVINEKMLQCFSSFNQNQKEALDKWLLIEEAKHKSLSSTYTLVGNELVTMVGKVQGHLYDINERSRISSINLEKAKEEHAANSERCSSALLRQVDLLDQQLDSTKRVFNELVETRLVMAKIQATPQENPVIETLLKGLTDIATQQVDATVALARELSGFQRTLLAPPENGYSEGGEGATVSHVRDEEAEIMDLIRNKGVSEDDARGRVRENRIYQGYAANNFGRAR